MKIFYLFWFFLFGACGAVGCSGAKVGLFLGFEALKVPETRRKVSPCMSCEHGDVASSSLCRLLFDKMFDVNREALSCRVIIVLIPNR